MFYIYTIYAAYYTLCLLESSESCISSESCHSRKNDRKKLVSKRRDWRRLSTRNHRHSWKHRHTRSKSLRVTIRNTQELEPRRINAEQKVTGDRASSSRQRTVNSQRIREREQNKEKRRSESSNRIKEPDRRKSHGTLLWLIIIICLITNHT